MDVNEQIIEQYLKSVKKWFYMTDIAFKVPHNYSNIDLLAYDPQNDRFYDFEVKFRSAFTISQVDLGNDLNFNKFINQFIKPERDEAIKGIVGEKPVTKVFVTTHKLFGVSDIKKDKMEKEFKNRISSYGFECEIWYFDDIIPELYKQTEKTGRYNSELMQTIRLIKTYM